MKTIWKYPLKITSLQIIEMPDRAAILSMQMQDNVPTIWALVDTDKTKAKWEIRVIGTGEPADDIALNFSCLGTVQQGPMVWHVFMKRYGRY